MAPAALRHRLLLNFEGEAEGVTTDAVVRSYWKRCRRLCVIFDEKTLRKLDRLALAASQVRIGQIKGERRSHQARHLDRVRRLPRLHSRRRPAPGGLERLRPPGTPLHQAAGRRRRPGRPLAAGCVAAPWTTAARWTTASKKFRFSQRLTAALAYIALAAGDRLTRHRAARRRAQPRSSARRAAAARPCGCSSFCEDQPIAAQHQPRRRAARLYARSAPAGAAVLGERPVLAGRLSQTG